MTRRNLALVCGSLLVLPLALTARGAEKKEGGKAPSAPTNLIFEKLKTLEGTWVAEGEDGKPTDQVVKTVKVTAGGSAIHEVIFPGQPMEMVSVYTVEGPDVVMTHYCVLGNQPRLKADPKSPANQIRFEFDGGANLDPKKDKHMHSAALTILDDSHVEMSGSAWDGGAPCKEQCCVTKLVRKK
ncbi:hypothetical protein OJF2_43890 [Aquisphaera giovannonii]|uniref:DUF1579 domain-containing protein n=1 Tax=Aquisphaera giovannonii TaxID=406548 RepID=A0A5B9W5C5_9BACT|nr:hypothetical protein [Aquisphaera giovannonii]QEH35832.1 hypothetical protein OJF2_43890 [Aquisphaera giovannonii]